MQNVKIQKQITYSLIQTDSTNYWMTDIYNIITKTLLILAPSALSYLKCSLECANGQQC